ncbi:MAG: PP2C family protein-serine/threonine phosphatase, partial [Alphaproteobacteria bacterium]
MSSQLQDEINGFERTILSSSILIVEDNEISRLFLERTLRGAGYQNVRAVCSAKEAFNALQHIQPELIILDIIMPETDGFDCCKEIRRRLGTNKLPVLIQTVLTEPELRVKAFTMGATDFISKPVFPAELCARVRVHLEKSLSLKSLQQYKERIEYELKAARELQLSILPHPHDIRAACQNGKLDVSALFKPALEIGGDCWGMKNISQENHAFWLADFSGHGVASALNTFRLQAYLREYCTIMTRPGDYLTYLNDKLRHLLMRGQFATMFYALVDTRKDVMQYSCACSPHPIIRHGDTGQVKVIDGSGVPLGVGMELYRTLEAPIRPGDMIVLYSDALVETEDHSGRYIGEGELV